MILGFKKRNWKPLIYNIYSQDQVTFIIKIYSPDQVTLENSEKNNSILDLNFISIQWLESSSTETDSIDKLKSH